jgi:hypothetical protein
MLERREECDTYVCSREVKYRIELSANTVAFISCRSRLTKVLAGDDRGEKGSKGGERRVRLPDVDTGRLSGLKYKFICCFKLAADMVGVASGSL